MKIRYTKPLTKQEKDKEIQQVKQEKDGKIQQVNQEKDENIQQVMQEKDEEIQQVNVRGFVKRITEFQWRG